MATTSDRGDGGRVVAPNPSVTIGDHREGVRVFGVEKFNGEGYTDWAWRMKVLFEHYGLLDVMESNGEAPELAVERSAWARKSSEGYLLLSQCLGPSQVRHIRDLLREPARGPLAWKAIQDVHAPSKPLIIGMLEKELGKFEIHEHDSVEEGVEKWQDLVRRLDALGFHYTTEQLKHKLLGILPESYQSLVVVLSRELGSTSLEGLKAAVLQESLRRKTKHEGAAGAFGARGYGGGKSKGRKGFGKPRGHGYGGNHDGDSNGGSGRISRECGFCHKRGHRWMDCWTRK